MAKKKPDNPLLPEHEEQFDRLIQKWQGRLNLSDWRIIKRPGRSRGVLAEVFDFDTPHKLAKYRLGYDAGFQPVSDEMLESTAIHEMLHVLLHPALEAAFEEREYNDAVMAAEHSAVNVLTDLLLRLAQLEQLVGQAVAEGKQ